jgi:hypothetical protein
LINIERFLCSFVYKEFRFIVDGKILDLTTTSLKYINLIEENILLKEKMLLLKLN